MRTVYSCATALLLFALSALARGAEPITIYLAGDSTMAEKVQEKRPETGWGEILQLFFNKEQVRVSNRAKNGRSTRTFISAGLWEAIVASLKAGDYVFIQFGHNDESKEKTERYTPPEDYRKNLIRFVADVRAKNAIPVLLTPLARRRFDNTGKFQDTHGEYPGIVRAVAAENKVPLIDMHRESQRVLEEFGSERSKGLFLHLKPGEHRNYPDGIEDNTHFSPLGAATMAGLALEGIRKLKLGLADYLSELQQPRGARPRAVPGQGQIR